MEKEKIIEKLLKKAKEIKEVEISPENLIEMDIEAFYDTYKQKKGKLYYKDNKIYQEAEKGWYVVKVGINLRELEKKISNVEGKVKDIEKWAYNIKSYMDKEFKEIKDEIIKLKNKKEKEVKKKVKNGKHDKIKK